MVPDNFPNFDAGRNKIDLGFPYLDLHLGQPFERGSNDCFLDATFRNHPVLSISLHIHRAYAEQPVTSAQKTVHVSWPAHPIENCGIALRDLFDNLDQIGTTHGLSIQPGEREVVFDVIELKSRGPLSGTAQLELSLEPGASDSLSIALPGCFVTKRTLANFGWSSPSKYLQETIEKVLNANAATLQGRVYISGLLLRGNFGNLVVNLEGIKDVATNPCAITFVSSLENMGSSGFIAKIGDAIGATHKDSAQTLHGHIEQLITHLANEFREHDALFSKIADQEMK